MSPQNVYVCRICQMTPNISGIKTEAEWIQHLISDSHQDVHRSHQLLRKVLWDLDRTVAITKVMGIQKQDILSYVVQLGYHVVDFSYLSSINGKTDSCYALLSSMWVQNRSVIYIIILKIFILSSEVDELSNTSHCIQQNFTIRRIDDKEKRKYLKWKENLIKKK